MGIRKMGRDESMMEYAMKLLIQVLINFSMGMIGKWNITISMYDRCYRKFHGHY